MGHLFSSSFSVLGELMQNARRAGASCVKFTLDDKARSLGIEDDGHGINDFAQLIELCDSNWSEDIVLTDKPFGMGLFSVFYAGKSVQFLSNGLSLAITLEDIIAKRSMHVVADKNAPLKGTRVVISGLADKFFEIYMARSPERTSQTRNHVVDLAEGFPIPVLFNGEELAQPYARGAMAFDATDIGFVSIPNIHNGGQGAIGNMGRPRLFLQGLPIGGVESWWQKDRTVVHLDSTRFVAKMPDRKELFDQPEQLKTIDNALAQEVRAFLVKQKTVLSPEEMVRRHWNDCFLYGVSHLLDDLPFVPAKIFDPVEAVCQQSDCISVYGPSDDAKSDLISREELLSGVIKAWFNCPTSSDEDAWAVVTLKVMQSQGILAVNGSVGADHWLRDILLSSSDLEFDVTASNPSKEVQGFNAATGGLYAEIRLCDGIAIKVTSKTDPAFRMDVDLANDWVMVPQFSDKNGEEDDRFDRAYDVFVCRTDESSDCPIDALSTYYDSNDEYREDWRDDDAQIWEQLMSSLRGEHLAGLVQRVINNGEVRATEPHLSQFVLCQATRKTPTSWINITAAPIVSDEFEKLAAAIGAGVTAQQLANAFQTVFASAPAQEEANDSDGSDANES